MSARPHIALVNLGAAHWLGGHHYYQHIIRALAALPEAERNFELTYIVGAPLAPELDADLSRHCRILVASEIAMPQPRFVGRVGRLVRRRLGGLYNVGLHDLLVRERIDFAYPCVTGGEKRGRYRTAHWIADLQFKHFPQFQLPAALVAERDYLEQIVKVAKTIVVSSTFGEADCHLHYPQTIGRTFVMPFRVTPSVGAYSLLTVGAPARYNLPPRFFVLSNQFWQNKNHMVVFDAVALLKRRGVDVNVVCTGHLYDPRLPAYSDRVLARLHEAGIADRIYLLGAIPRMDQLDLMRRAVAVLQPSLFEGWNTSIEEARFFGKAVIASAIPVHREQAWTEMTLFDPNDAEALAIALETAWREPQDGRIDAPTEAIARERYASDVLAFARNFLTLASDQR